MQTTLLVKSSSGNPYEVVFDFTDDDQLTVTCSCAAGTLGQLCKHVLALIGGDCSMLFSSNDEQSLIEVLKAAKSCSIFSDYSALQNRLSELDLRLKQVKQQMEKEKRQLKATFARKLREGYPLA